ncbi:U32 family peptidase [Vibrio hannami]|uniref:peptidase U32 family protein n=1 Tax=Vibrio hannami TaxID=2717094 RepID=UPI00240ECFD2|nr:peptidase U32 family protein [Vibrio hannami]MDG3085934.1 U32 family peptidase [Vibrio hannami]
MDTSKFEILAPGGDADSIKAAIVAGADAVYCGLDRFNARNRATNLSMDQLNEVVNLAHQHECKIFVTLNIMILEPEIAAVIAMLNRLLNTEIDGVIVQDLGLAYIIKQFYPQLDMHASTQMNTHNEGQIKFLHKFGVSRVNLSRELSQPEIKRLATFGKKLNVLMEVFVHGSYCIGFSGLCYVSSVRNGASGNRGRCSQPCRDEYQITETGSRYPLNMKDNSAYLDLEALADAGVYSLKIEGRIKGSHYVYTTVNNWRNQVDRYCNSEELSEDRSELYTVYNRDFSDGYLKGDISEDMFIENPRDHSTDHFVSLKGDTSPQAREEVKQQLYDAKTSIIDTTERKIAELNTTAPVVSEEFLSRKGIDKTRVLRTLLGASEPKQEQARLSVLISDTDSIPQAEDVDLFFQLPSNLSRFLDSMMNCFAANPSMTAVFPAILIDQDYDAALEFLKLAQPKQVILNNTGLVEAVNELGISWIAGPQLNIANSFALKALTEEFHCSGAFISNEINATQMKKLVAPEGFRLFYSLYHPSSIMVSRQCLFQQSTGCKKMRINKGCLPRCSKHTSIINLKDSPYIVDKQKGDYNHLYSQYHKLNTDIVTDMKDLYSDFMIDLRDIQTETKVDINNEELITRFKQLLSGDENAAENIRRHVYPTANSQYRKGL